MRFYENLCKWTNGAILIDGVHGCERTSRGARALSRTLQRYKK
jgi:hypothetical protein